MSFGRTILDRIGKFSEEDVSLFESKCNKRQFAKNEILLNEGQYCKTAFYITSGAAYQFSWNDIDENIMGLYIEEDWCFNYYSFINRKPSNAIIKAYTDLEVLELKGDSIHELILQSPAFFQLGHLLEEPLKKIQYFESANTALEKHSHLFLSKPDLFQRFPLKMIASYLKIAPETLSRIRNIR
jgi:CRP-like cAMP-binding protein